MEKTGEDLIMRCRAARLDVTYDPTVGYPIRVFIDRHPEHADDEESYTLSSFRVSVP